VSAYFSFPRMAARGYLRFGRQWRRVEGGVWMDRERGTVRFSRELGGWDWFGLQFRDGRAAMISRIRDAAGQETARSAGTLIEPDGHTTRLGAGEFEVRPLDHWVSPRTGIAYPQRWRIRVPAWDAEWTVTPYLRDQELDTRGGTGVIYWEGAARVAGRASGRSSVGDAFVELSGYDRGRGIRGLYDFETNRIGAGAFLADQVRAIWRCGGVSRRTATVREAEEGVRP
jgi:predicted secreted hydrolase